jgi:hypothetical protein
VSAVQNRPPAPIDSPPENPWVYLDRLASHLAAGGKDKRWSTRSTCWALALGCLALVALVVIMTGLVAIAYVMASAGPWGIASLTAAASLLVSGHAARRWRRPERPATRGRAAGGRRRPS